MFRPTLWLRNRHLQTLYAPLFRRQPQPRVEIERFELEDGDFVECYWHHHTPRDTRPIVILFHGLAGSFSSPYIQGVMRALDAKGLASVLMHFRGTSGIPNRLPRSYHSGDTADAKAWIDHLHTTYPDNPLHAVGYSIGGNMLLKLLGEERSLTPLRTAVSISAPLELDIAAKTINQGFAKLYQSHLLAPLKKSLWEKYQQFDMERLLNQPQRAIASIRTIYDFDEYYTAPIHGFASARAYYQQCSAKAYLRTIAIPTLLIHALDDPFMTPAVLPTQEETSPTLKLLISEHGGHVGFVAQTPWRPHYWLEHTIADYLSRSTR